MKLSGLTKAINLTDRVMVSFLFFLSSFFFSGFYFFTVLSVTSKYTSKTFSIIYKKPSFKVLLSLQA